MLCECMSDVRSFSANEFLALVRNVDRVELETPAVVVYLIECRECRGIHSLEVPVSDCPAGPLLPAVELWAWLTGQQGDQAAEQLARCYKRAA